MAVTATARVLATPLPANTPSKSRLGTIVVTFRGVGDLGFSFGIGAHAGAPATQADLAVAYVSQFESADNMSASRDPLGGTWDVTLTFKNYDFSTFTVGNNVWVCEMETSTPSPTTPIDAAAGPFAVVA